MRVDSLNGAQLCNALSKFRERQRYGKYPQQLREQALAYCAEQSRSGATVTDLAAELGVYEATVSKWLSAGRRHLPEAASSTVTRAAGLSLVPIVVRPEPSQTSRVARMEVEFPDGTRLAASGIGGRELAEAIESLRRSR